MHGAVGEIGQPMVGIINDGFDRNREALNTMTHLRGVTATQVQSMFSGANAFTSRGAIRYNPTGVGGYNSNSFIAGLLTHAGVRRPSLSGSVAGGFPGWNNPIPARFYRLQLPIESSPGFFFV